MAASLRRRALTILPNDRHRPGVGRHGPAVQRADRHDQDAAAEDARRGGGDGA